MGLIKREHRSARPHGILEIGVPTPTVAGTVTPRKIPVERK